MFDQIQKVLESFGYTIKEVDMALLLFCLQKVESQIKNDCNINGIPVELEMVVVERSIGEFFLAKKTFAPKDIDGLDFEMIAKQVQIGDTSITFAVGDGGKTPEQRFDIFVQCLLSSGHGALASFRKVRW